MIKVKNLNKVFKVHTKEAGFKNSFIALFNRKYIIKRALENINLEIDEGEIIGLIGSNGAGKTTLTKILSGIVHPSSGEVEVLGHNPWKKNNHLRKNMSLIMGQKAQLWWDLPASDGFLLLKEIYQIPDEEYNETIDYLSTYLDIKDELNIQVRKLSLGERMKVELMAALIHKPKVVFLDEPTIGLDLTAQKAIRSFIKEYRKRYNPIMILTSHYMQDIEELCERIVILKQGKVIYDGKMSKIKSRYDTRKKITAFIDNINLDEIEHLGEVQLKNESVEIVSDGENYMEIIKELSDKYKIKDLSIQSEDISQIIESIISTKK